MKKSLLKKGFTLIELLVVITIIGILATGGVAIYNTQIQKARDTTRIGDVQNLKSSAEQAYQDLSSYPSAITFYTQMKPYLPLLPVDSKYGQACNGSGASTTKCTYSYKADADVNGITLGAYEFSVGFENVSNRTEKAAKDNGNDAARYEVGTLKATTANTDIDTAVLSATAISATKKGACTPAGATAATDNALVIVNGAPSSGECN